MSLAHSISIPRNSYRLTQAVASGSSLLDAIALARPPRLARKRLQSFVWYACQEAGQGCHRISLRVFLSSLLIPPTFRLAIRKPVIILA